MPKVDVREQALLRVPITLAASLPADQVLAQLGSSASGLPPEEAKARLQELGPNAVRTHRANGWAVLGRQFAGPILILLLITAGLSLILGDVTNSIVIGAILLVSVGLGFSNEYRAELASEALHSRVTHRATVLRRGTSTDVEVTALVPGDVVRLVLGAIIPADIRLLASSDLFCDESILTGESQPAAKDTAPVPAGGAVADLASCAFMGTVIQSGSCTGVVVATGGRTEFGRIALGLGERQPRTEFQLGLKRSGRRHGCTL